MMAAILVIAIVAFSTAAAFTGTTFNTLAFSGVSMIWTRARENAFMTGKPSGEVVYFDCR